jgi:hypothetical protein
LGATILQSINVVCLSSKIAVAVVGENMVWTIIELNGCVSVNPVAFATKLINELEQWAKRINTIRLSFPALYKQIEAIALYLIWYYYYWYPPYVGQEK